MAISALKLAASAQSPRLASRFFSQTARVQEDEQQPLTNGGVGTTSDNGIFVRNLAFTVDAEQLKTAFEKFGTVVGAQVARDDRGMSKG